MTSPWSRPLILGLVIAVLVYSGLWSWNRTVGARNAEIDRATVQALELRRQAVKARARGDSLAAVARVLAVEYRTLRAARARVVEADAPIEQAARAAADSAREVLRDTAATAPALRVQVVDLLSANAGLDSALQRERLASDRAIAAADPAIDRAQEALQAKDAALVASEASYQAERAVSEALRRARGNWWQRSARALWTGAATTVGAAAGYVIAGPVAAVIGGVVGALASAIPRG